MAAEHQLVIHIEHCKADRPSKVGCSRGGAETKAGTSRLTKARSAPAVSVHINEGKIHHELAGGSPLAARGESSRRNRPGKAPA